MNFQQTPIQGRDLVFDLFALLTGAFAVGFPHFEAKNAG